MILQVSRPVFRLPQLKLQCLGSRRTVFSIQRVAALYNAFQPDIPEFAPKDSSITSILRRSYATKPVSRPKAHTGRTTTAAKKAPTTSKTKAAKKPAVKKTSPKAKPTAKSKAKPRIKPKPKAGKKPKPKPKPKKVLTEAQKKAATIKELKVTALTTPHSRPFTAWTVLAAESQGASTTGSLTSKMKEASAKFKNLSPEQLEHYNHIANQNKAARIKAYREWVESHTPLVIYEANLARLNLKRRGVTGYPQIEDHRQVKGPVQPFAHFNRERHASGDLKGLKIAEAARLISREWKALSANERKPYDDLSQQEMVRYIQERKTVYNKDVQHLPKAASAA